MADNPIASPFAGLQGLLQNILGASTKSSENQNLNTDQILKQLMSSTDAGSQTTNTSTSGDVLTKLISSLTGNTTQTTSNNADVSNLQKVFQQQQAGITPDMLKAIFTEGAKAVPQLVATSANAVGARSSDNSPLATTLRDLNTNLASTAATQNTQMLKDSATTAAQIADLTKSTTGNTVQAQTTNQDTNQNSNQNVLSALTSLLTKNQTTNQDQTTAQNKKTDGTTQTGINMPQTAGAAGLAALLGALNGGAGSGGLSSLLGSLKGLIGGGGDATGTGDGSALFGGADFLSGLGDTGAGFDTSGTGDYSNGYTDPSTGGDPINWFNDPTTPQFADGGIVGKPEMLSLTNNQTPHAGVAALVALASVLGKMQGNVPGSTSAKQ